MRIFVVLLCFSLCILSCVENKPKNEDKIRKAKDFARYDWQMDSIYQRLQLKDSANDLNWKTAISPHDNYRFTDQLYYKSLRGINAPHIILIGVAHRARNYNLQDKMIFGTFTKWESPYGSVDVSSLNEDIIEGLTENNFVVHDSMQIVEHSLEAIIPWLHKKNRTMKIVPILVPYMDYPTIDSLSNNLAKVVHEIIDKKNWKFGKDVAVVISNDAVHYGDLEWGDSKNMAPMGTDSTGTKMARDMDKKIINECLTGNLSDKKIKKFTEYTVQKDDYKEYKWVWCGRYSVPFGLSFSNKLNLLETNKNLKGTFLGYKTSIDHPLMEVEDLGMEVSALSTNRHWVGYTSIVYQ